MYKEIKDNNITTLIVPVIGMSCASCAGSAENIASQSEGVIQASVNYGTGNLTVTFDSIKTSIENIQQAIREGGYDLLIEDESKQQAALEQINEHHLHELKLKTVWSVLLAIPVMIIGMFFMHMPYANYIMWLLSTPVVFYFGKGFYINAWKQIKHRTANMDTLVALSTGIAYLFSLFNMLFPSFWQQRGIQTHVYFEASSVIIAFILLGKLLEEKAKSNTSSAIKKLIGLQPKTVTIILKDGTEVITQIEHVRINDIILVKPGEKIAVDGIVIGGNSHIDESMLTGEPIPILKEISSKVYAGTINQKGSLHYKALKVGKDTLLAQIIKTVKEAQGSKAPVQKLVDKIASIFVPTVMGIALFTLLCWIIFGGQHAVTQGLLASITVLIIACPCALGLATPTAIMVGIGKSAEQGILIKDALSLEILKKVNTIILDKTGTITEGKPQVNEVKWLNNEVIYKRILLSIEKQSEHPLADAIISHLNEYELVSIHHFISITGKGAKADFNSKSYYVGNKQLMLDNHIVIPNHIQQIADLWYQKAKTVIWFSDNQQVLGILAISDKIKDTSINAIHTLNNMGIELYMLTGDNQHTAKAIAQQTKISNYKAEVLPQEKALFIKKLQEQGKIVAMVGDGINDSTALATADISIAMGKGSDIAMEVSKMTIISSDLSKIASAIQLSKHTVTTIKQNLFWAFIYNIIGIPIAAGILYPVNGFLLNPMIAGAAMAMSSVSVVSNSLLLKLKKIND